jgi:starch-binding outer membrane protein, SusD/RagB family
MKKLYYNILINGSIALLFIFGVSCQKLDENPKGQIVSAKFYTTPGQCESAFAASMNTLYNAWEGYYNLQGTLGDGQFFSEGSNLTFGADFASDYWIIHYRAILDINSVLKAINRGSIDQQPAEVVSGIVAQGKFLRAFNYFTLVRLYGKIPYITEDTPDPVVTPLTPESRLEISTVYDKIEEDLQFAIGNLPDYDPSAPARPNLWIAKALLSKVYVTRATAPLNQAEYYVKARDMSGDVIDNGPYTLLPDFRDVFKTSNKNNMEVLFAFQTTDDDPNIEGIANAPSEFGGWSGAPVKPAWAEAYPEQPRKHNYILLDFPQDIYDPSSPIIHYTESIDGTPYIGKYNIPNLTLEEELGISKQYNTLIRFPDVLLIYAEAANMANGGPTQLAVDRVNMIIDRANESTGTEPRASLSMTTAQFDDKVMEERNLELCFEYDRYFDVLRKRILEQVNLPDNANGYQETDYLLPIPVFDALSIGQNPGY